MPQLPRKGARPLLSRIGNKVHATDDDHEEVKPNKSTMGANETKAQTEEDISRSPRSSENSSSGVEEQTKIELNSDIENENPSKSSKKRPTRNLFTEIPRTKSTNKRGIKPPTRAALLGRQQEKKRRAEDTHEDGSPQKKVPSPKKHAESFGKEPAWLQRQLKPKPKKHIPKTTFSKTGNGTKPAKQSVGKTNQWSQKRNDSLKAKFEGLIPVVEEKHAVNADLKSKFDFLLDPIINEQEHLASSTESLKAKFDDLDTSKWNPDTKDQSALVSWGNSPPSSAPSSDILDAVDTIDVGDTLTVCPLCKAPVDAKLLQDFLGDRLTLRIRQQNDFHILHQKHDASEEYRKQGYPAVDWSSLEDRLANHHKHLQGILEDTVPSHFRSQLAKKVNSGKDRTLYQASNSGALKGIMPGYYGTRGARLMAEYIIRKYGPVLRQLAANDNMIGSRDTTGFVQAVLVPELTTKLIMEDIDVDERRAREVMEESVALGNLVNEEVDDILRMTQAASQNLSYEDDDDDYS